MDVNQEERVQELANVLSNLQLNHQSEQQKIDHLSNEIGSIKVDLNTIKLTLQDVTQRLLAFHHQMSTFQHPPPVTQSFSDVSVMTHALFSGNPKEINKFLYFIKDQLVEVKARFTSEKSKINWVVRHFCHLDGNISDTDPSYLWWISVLRENAQTQNLPSKLASAEDPYVLPCLISICTFLSHLEEVFANSSSIEDAKRALYSCKQGNKPLDVFNSLFCSLVFAFDLTEDCRIDVYKAAINPKILEIAIQKDSWKEATDLKQKMALCILASNILDELTMLRANLSTKRVDFQLQQPPPPPLPNSNATPMDIDAITASIGFTFSAYRALCVKHKLCQRCHKAYDETHISNRSCPNTEVQMKDKIALFTKLSKSAPSTTHLTQIDLGTPSSGAIPLS
ncbi:hypothetical protein PTTG_28916 [Puccinia triticina 1-1 BBBD Race 1]|uniref:Uncharacterized protein n=1 Tax=Puccinia triticina (isolate 1-1 / race 1 (BBBD)) TaxID=630390 RepID=A0A180GA30_PUCT1|nr:hypothetical protein PTTG_28916 [Puccinia triticina 1-1 BBBD Race 1]